MTTPSRIGGYSGSQSGLRSEVHVQLFAFMRELRTQGIPVQINKQIDFLRGISVLRPSTIQDLYWIGVATLVTSTAHKIIFDRVFTSFFGLADETNVSDKLDQSTDEDDDQDEQHTGGPSNRHPGDQIMSADVQAGTGVVAGGVVPDAQWRVPLTCSHDCELLAKLCEELTRSVPLTRSRRHQTRRRGDIDLRATYLNARHTFGEIVLLRRRHRPTRQRRVLLLIDVSGSVKQYSPTYLRFAHSILNTCTRAEAFTFGTRLTRVTPALRGRNVDDALQAISHVVLDAEGGTFLGLSLHEFLSDPTRVTMARDALVIVLSDGLERGDCKQMIESTARLARLASHLAWWSPLASAPDYEPLTRGMSAIHGDLDALVGVDDLESALAAVRARFEQVPRMSSEATHA